jgi:hypothetical protein
MLNYTILPDEYQPFLSLILNDRLCSIRFSQLYNTQSSLRQLFPVYHSVAYLFNDYEWDLPTL